MDETPSLAGSVDHQDSNLKAVVYDVSEQQRARMIGAEIEIRSVSSGGTKIELRVPTS